jgi:hypothetical protein
MKMEGKGSAMKHQSSCVVPRAHCCLHGMQKNPSRERLVRTVSGHRGGGTHSLEGADAELLVGVDGELTLAQSGIRLELVAVAFVQGSFNAECSGHGRHSVGTLGHRKRAQTHKFEHNT